MRTDSDTDGGASMRNSVIRRYYVHRALLTSGFFWPVFPLFLRARGISFAGIGTLLAIEAGVMLISEVPTGYLGDALGRRNSLIAGSCLMLLGLIGYVFAQSFSSFAGIYIAFGLARTFWSGSGDAWLYDLLDQTGVGGEFTRIRGRGESVTHWASTIAMLASGVLYSLNPVIPFVISAAVVTVDIFLLMTLPSTGSADENRVTVREAAPIIYQTLTKSNIWSFVAVAAVFFGIEYTVSEFVPSVTTAVLGTSVPTPTHGGSTDVVFLGVFFAGFTATSAIASMYAGSVRSRIGAPLSLLGAGFLSAALLIGGLVNPPIVLLGFVAIKTSHALVLPIVNGYVNDHTETGGRATTLSAMSMLFSITKMPLLVGIGALADATDVFIAVGSLGVIFVTLAAGILTIEFPVNVVSEENTPAE